MTFFESIKTVFRKYAEFEGRATRPEFWWFTLFSAVVASALGAFNVTTTNAISSGLNWGANNGMFDGTGTSSTVYLGASLASVWGFAVLIPSLAVTIRRLRDAGREWTNIFWILLPIAGLIILVIYLAEPTRVDAPVVAAPPVLEK